MALSFHRIEKTNPLRTSMIKITVRVLLDGKHVGTIHEVKGGYQYWPRGSKTGGEIFKSVGDCERSLKS